MHLAWRLHQPHRQGMSHPQFPGDMGSDGWASYHRLRAEGKRKSGIEASRFRFPMQMVASGQWRTPCCTGGVKARCIEPDLSAGPKGDGTDMGRSQAIVDRIDGPCPIGGAPPSLSGAGCGVEAGDGILHLDPERAIGGDSQKAQDLRGERAGGCVECLGASL